MESDLGFDGMVSMVGRNDWTREQIIMAFRAVPNPASRGMGVTQSDHPKTCGLHSPFAIGGGFQTMQVGFPRQEPDG
jgi:hypothetical protein